MAKAGSHDPGLSPSALSLLLSLCPPTYLSDFELYPKSAAALPAVRPSCLLSSPELWLLLPAEQEISEA